jgi:hypothetical protein
MQPLDHYRGPRLRPLEHIRRTNRTLLRLSQQTLTLPRRPPAAGPGGGCARRPVGTYLYLHAVGDGNPVAVPCLARQGAERGTDSCDPRDQQLSGSHVRRVLEKYNIRTLAHGYPARPVRYGFSATKYSQILSRHGGNGVLGMFFRRGRVQTDQRWDEGVGAGGGQLGSSARARRSLAPASHARVFF